MALLCDRGAALASSQSACTGAVLVEPDPVFGDWQLAPYGAACLGTGGLRR
ncbi:MAG: hypothetical protein WAV54_12395 [Acidimicrobiales bacterium]